MKDENTMRYSFLIINSTIPSSCCSSIDAAAYSELGLLIICDIRAKPVERSELGCQIWWFAFREHTFKIKQWL
jgi:hypothetical protein